ncbi:MAG: TonB-dependent receptor [Chitinophagaceae bacterium]|nr:MAG: TonB-dependent receptor [Chitinophagaceae bacterium]
MRVFFVSLILVLFLSESLSAQGVINGKLVDSLTKQTLSLATVTVFRAKDTTIITYRLSDGSGVFRVPGIPFDVPMRVVISFSGYRGYRREFSLSRENPSLELGDIRLVNDPASLDEVVITAERPPVSIKKDTIEFNASAFKTLPTALVEDLLKKLPGVDVDKDGNISVNGRKANRILVDGKEFFGGDPKVATRNLPADIIDKVQVSDDKEQLNMNPDIAKADLGQVINLKLKKSIKQGVFGKLYAGAGTDDRYEAGGIVNMFRDTFQVSALAYTNNLNKAGFGAGDIQSLGGFQRSGINSISINSEGGFSFNDISFGGTGQGIQKSTGAGINANNQFGKNLTVNLQYFFGHINSKLQQVSNTQQFFGDSSLTTRSNTSQVADDYNHRIGGKIRWKIDSLSELQFTPSITLRTNTSSRDLHTESFSSFRPKLNESRNLQDLSGNSNGYSHLLYYNKNFRKKGRSINITNNIRLNSFDNDQLNNVANFFYDSLQEFTRLDQLRARDQNTFSSNFSLTYSEPVSKSLTLRIANSADYFNDRDDVATFNKHQSGPVYDSLNQELTNGFSRDGFRNNASAGLRWKLGKVTIGPSVNFQSLNIRNRFVKDDPIRQDFFFVLPSLTVQWNSLYISYNASAQEPNVNDLQPVIDNTNPLYQQLGNPSLVPAVRHNLNINTYKYDTKSQLTYNLYANGSLTDNAVIREREVNDQGVQISYPLNVDGIKSISLSASIRKQIKFINSWQLTFGTGIYGNAGRSVVIVNKTRSEVTNTNISPSLNASFNWKDKFEFTQQYSINWNKSKYDNSVYPGLELVRHYSTSEAVVRLPKHWVWESTVDYWYNPVVAPGIRKSNFRWNAGLNYLFLKDDKGQLKFSVYDLLNRNIGVSRTIRENYIQDNQTTVLQRYFMLTFTYNIRNFAGGKVGGRQNMFMF